MECIGQVASVLKFGGAPAQHCALLLCSEDKGAVWFEPTQPQSLLLIHLTHTVRCAAISMRISCLETCTHHPVVHSQPSFAGPQGGMETGSPFTCTAGDTATSTETSGSWTESGGRGGVGLTKF